VQQHARAGVFSILEYISVREVMSNCELWMLMFGGPLKDVFLLARLKALINLYYDSVLAGSLVKSATQSMQTRDSVVAHRSNE
jgi:hypothetical protein